MKTVAIVTPYGEFNFGNKLQNFASVYLLKQMNVIPETLRVYESTLNYSNKTILKKQIKNILSMIPIINSKFIDNKRENIFREYSKKYLNISKKEYSTKNFNYNYLKKFNYIIVGSDQVWNYSNFNDSDFNYYLQSNPINNNLISFSASFGVSSIPDNLKLKYAKSLNNFKYISVREDAGKQIVEELIGKEDVKLLIDPTMMLTSVEWDKLIKESKAIKKLEGKKYILNYFLGNLSEERKQEINKIAKENNCEIINILDKNDPFYLSGPSEFLWLEKNAFLICTDSFHSSVFAIIYNNPFIVFDREQDGIISMNSRIETLINKFKLKDREYNGINITKKNLEHDYTEAYKILEDERKKSKLFLKEALNIEE